MTTSVNWFIGSIQLFAGNFAPYGWRLCDGQLLEISKYQALYSILGTTYGGNGVTTFALPDLRGRAPIHAGQGPGLPHVILGQRGGFPTATLTASNMPHHNHLLMANMDAGGETKPGPNRVLGTGGGYASQAPNVNMSQSSILPTGSNLPFSIEQPYLALNYIIALEGIFPTRT